MKSRREHPIQEPPKQPTCGRWGQLIPLGSPHTSVVVRASSVKPVMTKNGKNEKNIINIIVFTIILVLPEGF